MTVAANMAAVPRLENPRRLSSFGDQVLLRNKWLVAERENQHKDSEGRKEECNEGSC